jgi:hypothetical protein
MIKSLLVTIVLFSINTGFAHHTPSHYQEEYNSLKGEIELNEKAEQKAKLAAATAELKPYVCAQRGLGNYLFELRSEARALRNLISKHQDTVERREALNDTTRRSLDVSRCMAGVSKSINTIIVNTNTYVDRETIKCRSNVAINCDGETVTFSPADMKLRSK